MAQQGGQAYQHYYSYGIAMQRPGTAALCLRFLSGSSDVARAIVITQSFGPIEFQYIPRGAVYSPGADIAAIYKALTLYAKTRRLRFVLISPDAVARDDDPVPQRRILTGETQAIVDLERAGPDLKAGMLQKWRNRLNKALRADIEIKSVPATHLHARWLTDAETSQRKRMAYKGLDAALPGVLARAKGQTRDHYCIALAAGVPVAGASFIVNGAYAAYFSGVTSPQGRALCAQHLVVYEATQRLRAKGVKTLNLGVINTRDAPGLARFKLGAGAQPYTCKGTFLLV